MKRTFPCKTSLSAILLLCATTSFASRLVTEGEVNAKDKAVLANLGSSNALKCIKNGQGSRALATEAYVNACDAEILSTVTPSSPFQVGKMLCGNTPPYTCPTNNPTPWGIVIYADPNPQISGYYGLAMSIIDVVPGFVNGSGTGTVWAAPALQSTDISANNYGIYGGINGTFKDYQGNSQNGNTKIYCNYSGNDCSIPTSPPTTSAFNACVNYSQGPSLAGGWYLPSIAEVEQMFLFAQTQPLNLSIAGVQTFNSFWYWASTQYNSSTNAYNFGNLGYVPSAGDPADKAFFFGFVDATQNLDVKSQDNEAVRCVQALPL
jgi:hypothetical protein